jgi:hypothetical protein
MCKKEEYKHLYPCIGFTDTDTLLPVYKPVENYSINGVYLGDNVGYLIK